MANPRTPKGEIPQAITDDIDQLFDGLDQIGQELTNLRNQVKVNMTPQEVANTQSRLDSLVAAMKVLKPQPTTTTTTSTTTETTTTSLPTP